MNSSFCLWLADTEDMLWRMIRGVFHFAFLRLPEWVYRTLLDTVGPVTVRLIRVFVVVFLLLAIVFGPVIIAAKFSLPSWGNMAATVWLVLALIGAMWGRCRFAKKRLAAEQRTDTDCPDLEGVSSRPEYAARY